MHLVEERINNKLSKTVGDMLSDMESHKINLESKMKHLGIKMDEVEQKTVWKITDCEQLLKK